MQVYKYPAPGEWNVLVQRPYTDNSAVVNSVQSIIAAVQKDGDAALQHYALRFDGINLESTQVSEEELTNAANLLTDELKDAITVAAANIERFHAAQQDTVKTVTTMPGITCWRKSVPIEKIGLYIPGGSAPLFSTVLMLGIPARLAGCKEVILCTPPAKDGAVHPAILYAAQHCGIRQVYKVGGAQAIAAMSYGTASIPAVYKIFGPGNQYVTVAKQLLQQEVAIDMPAGPSEVLVIADAAANPVFVAADLLSQAEHGPDSQVILVATDEAIAATISDEVKKQTALLPRKDIVEKALAQSRLVLVKDLETALAFSNRYAPEHLILACDDAAAWTDKVTSAGSVFIGHYSPESAGDYASGTNHTLPTNGYARMYSGVSLDSFVKKISFQQLSKEGLQHIGSTVMTMATAEGLLAHSRAVEVRLVDWRA